MPVFPSVAPDQLNDLLILAFGVFLLSYVEGVGASRTFASRHKYEIDANQELYANGGANLASGLMQGYSVGGSMSRSAVNDEAGARTPLAGLFAAIVIALVLLFLTEPFSYLPETVLAAIVIVAVKGLIDIPGLKRLFLLSKVDFLAATFTMLGVLTFGMLEGIIIGVLFSFLAVLKRVSLPHTSQLARRPGSNDFVAIANLEAVPRESDIMIFRADAGWFYANAPVIKQDFDRDVDHRTHAPSLVIIDLASAPHLDLGSISTLSEIRESLADNGVPLKLANVHREASDLLVAAAPAFGNVPASRSINDIVNDWERDQSPVSSRPDATGDH
jgi:MFS superfamily sulfate permease-like transporter